MFILGVTIAGAQQEAAHSRSPQEILTILVMGDSNSRRELARVMENKSVAVSVAKAGLSSSNKKEQLLALDLVSAMEIGELMLSVAELMNSDNEGIRSVTLNVAMKLPGTSSELIIKKALADKSEKIRAQALLARTIDSNESVLSNSLKDKSPIIALTAAYRSSYHGTKNSNWRRLARQHLDSKDEDVRARAIQLLGYCGLPEDQSEIEILMKERGLPPRLYSVASRAIKQIELSRLSATDQISYLKQQLNKAGNIPRLWAAEELVRRHRSGDNHAIEILKEIAADTDHPGRSEASEAIGLLDRE